MANTPVLGLPMIGSNQAQKHVPVNASFRDLDILVQLTVLDRNLTTPPATPNQGDRYIVAAGATGAWTGQANKIAAWVDAAWKFYSQVEGWLCYIQDEDVLVAWNGTSWTDIITGAGGMTLSTTQTASGAKTFSGTFVVSAASASLGTSTAASTINVGSGATLTATSKTVNIGTGGVSTSTTTINIGSAVAGSLGTTTINSPTVNFSSINTTINLVGTTTLAGTATTATLLYLGLGGATPDATNRLSLNTPSVLVNNAGTSVNTTLNKNAAGNDASFTFQTAFSTRALFGLLADDHFTIKVSPNGSSFFTGLNIRNADGNVGVGGASADANNGLSVSGNLLLNRKTASVGATLNKQAAGDDASFTFQTNFSTRALFGLLADDNFTIKVSPNGSSFITAFTINATTGRVTMTEGYQAIATDAAFTINPADPFETRHTGTLTAARACTLGTSGALTGMKKRLTRTGGGAFNITFAGKAMATNTWAEAVYDGAAWYLAAYGAL